MDWAELIPDILYLIVKKLGDISNFIHFRAVCKKWRLAAPTSDPPPQLPCLLESNIGFGNKFYRRIYSLYSNKTQNLHVPQAKCGTIHVGSSSQYVHIFDNHANRDLDSFRDLKLLNPLTGSQLPLPFKGSKVPIPWKEREQITTLYPHYVNRSHSCYSGEAIITMISGRFIGDASPLALLQLEDERNETTISLTKHILQRKIIFHEPKKLVTKLLDITTGDVVSVNSKQELRFSYLVEACGEVLGVVKHFETFDLNTPLDEVLFEVYRLEYSGTTTRWAKMNGGIGDRMLFLQYSFGSGFCLHASHFAGFKGNCIYFQEWNGQLIGNYNFFLGWFDIKEGKTELLHGEFYGAWFIPRM
ncbi:hypothetical protein FCM35_KLT13726 [Carex littledalei]|uniref:KIB1-4 beta-propeller domain-containing protein n=1 Tax=Carex littledalei TaxID=544730 RepID=A0A833VDI5_9POAL|nr:hypothetical protein FCM35_KLT13726 [Carex littledalei]